MAECVAAQAQGDGVPLPEQGADRPKLLSGYLEAQILAVAETETQTPAETGTSDLFMSSACTDCPRKLQLQNCI